MSDPTRVRNQRALNRGSGNTWVVIGAVLTVIAGLFFAFALNLEPAGLALTGLLAVIALFIAMLIARYTIPTDRLRLRTLAVLLLSIAVIAFVLLAIIAWAEWSAV